ncbi:MAG: membrane associated rhomboid family serine protease [Lentimonas sp.]
MFAACILVFALDALTASLGNFWMARFMMVPAEVTSSWRALLLDGVDWSQLDSLSTLLSYAFLHADAEHITMNLIFIWVFGSLVLRELGALWFFIAFVLTAMTGGIGQLLIEPHSMIPVLGASGALMGLEGIYLGMALRWRLPDPDIWPISYPISQERLILFAALGILMDVSGILGNDASIAFGAHIGGFIGGFFLGITFIPRPRNAR